MVISQQSSQLEEPILRPANPPIAFDIPPNAPFVLQFAKKRVVEVVYEDEPKPKEKPKPTATDAHTTTADGATPNPATNESLDWENDD